MGFFNRLANAIQRLPWLKPYWLWAVLLLTIPALGLLLSIVFWDWLSFDESRGTTIRNVGLIIAAVTALPLAIWRGLVAERQADAAQQSLRNERYQKGAEMLGSEVLSVRLGGIYALQRLAKEHPEEYHVQIMRLLCAFARNPTGDEDHRFLDLDMEVVHRIREDVQAVMEVIRKRDIQAVTLEQKEHFRWDLSNACIPHAVLNEANLTCAILSKTNLSNTILRKADLSQAILDKANLSSADLWEARLSEADLLQANLSTADLTGANLFNARLQGANLTSAKLWGTNFAHAKLNDSSLAHTQIWAAKLPNASLFGANLLGADLQSTDLSNAKLAQANLSNMKAQGINLSGANLRGSNLSSADLRRADLSGAQFWAACLSNALLRDANLSGAALSGIKTPSSLSPIIGLTQMQLDEARSDPENPPHLKGALDAETGQPLVWTGGRGAPLKDDE